MRRGIAVLTLALVPCALPAQTVDVFANEAGCDRLAGRKVTGDAVTILRPGALEFWESRCPVTNVTQVGSGGMVLTVTCTGEGETWADFYLLETSADPDVVYLTPDGAPDARRELRTCE